MIREMRDEKRKIKVSRRYSKMIAAATVNGLYLPIVSVIDGHVEMLAVDWLESDLTFVIKDRFVEEEAFIHLAGAIVFGEGDEYVIAPSVKTIIDDLLDDKTRTYDFEEIVERYRYHEDAIVKAASTIYEAVSEGIGYRELLNLLFEIRKAHTTYPNFPVADRLTMNPYHRVVLEDSYSLYRELGAKATGGMV